MVVDIRTAWELALSVTAGLGVVNMARWYWWRVNAWSEVAAMGAAMVCTALYAALRAYHPEVAETGAWAWLAGVPKGWLWFPFDAAVTTLISIPTWVAVTLLTPACDREHLRTFYRKVRPGGAGWKAVAADIEGFADDGPSWATAIGVMGGAAAIYGTLLGVGAVLLGHWGAAVNWLALAAIGTVLATRQAVAETRRQA